MPYGRLREYRHGDKRADCVIMTKCPADLSLEDKVSTIQTINPSDKQAVFFTGFKANLPQCINGTTEFNAADFDTIIALSGIASPDSFVAFCQSFGKPVTVHTFKDHHHYTTDDIKDVLNQTSALTAIICTEKDAVKLSEPDLLSLFPSNQLFSLPVRPYFLFDEEEKFRKFLKSKHL
jgi:tetraacyldisaccharide 4'-kinase